MDHTLARHVIYIPKRDDHKITLNLFTIHACTEKFNYSNKAIVYICNGYLLFLKNFELLWTSIQTLMAAYNAIPFFGTT